MLDDGRSQLIDQILSTIEFGEITHTEAERRIEQIIEAEISYPNETVNAELIAACESLLFQLHTHGSISYESHADRNWDTAHQRFSNWQERRTSVSRIAWYAAVLVVLFLSFGVGGVIHWRWFSEATTEDEQQHLVHGHELRFSLIQQAIAEYQEIGAFQFENINDLNTHIGFNLQIPETIEDDWQAQRLSVFYFPESIQVVVSYVNSEQRSLVYSQFYYTNYAEAMLAFEQNCEGDSRQCDGVDIYYSCNESRSLYVWTEQGVVYYLSGDVCQEDGFDIASVLRN